MEIPAPEIKERDVIDHNFLFASGEKFSLTTDPTGGDVVEELSDRYVFKIAPKFIGGNPAMPQAAETLSVFKQHIAVSTTHTRKQRDFTLEEATDIEQFIHAMSKQVQ